MAATRATRRAVPAYRAIFPFKPDPTPNSAEVLVVQHVVVLLQVRLQGVLVAVNCAAWAMQAHQARDDVFAQGICTLRRRLRLLQKHDLATE